MTRRVAGFLLLAGGFQWLVWPNFLRVVWRDERAFDGSSPTAFLLVHLAIILPALALATGLLTIGVRAWRRAPSGSAASTADRAPGDRLWAEATTDRRDSAHS